MSAISNIANGYSESRPYTEIQRLEAEAASHGVKIQPMFVKAPAEPEKYKSPPKQTPWSDNRGGRTTPQFDTTQKLYKHQPLGYYDAQGGNNDPASAYSQHSRSPSPRHRMPGHVHSHVADRVKHVKVSHKVHNASTATAASRTTYTGDRVRNGPEMNQIRMAEIEGSRAQRHMHAIRVKRAEEVLFEQLYREEMGQVNLVGLSHGQKRAAEREVRQKVKQVVKAWRFDYEERIRDEHHGMHTTMSYTDQRTLLRDHFGAHSPDKLGPGEQPAYEANETDISAVWSRHNEMQSPDGNRSRDYRSTPLTSRPGSPPKKTAGSTITYGDSSTTTAYGNGDASNLESDGALRNRLQEILDEKKLLPDANSTRIESDDSAMEDRSWYRSMAEVLAGDGDDGLRHKSLARSWEQSRPKAGPSEREMDAHRQRERRIHARERVMQQRKEQEVSKREDQMKQLEAIMAQNTEMERQLEYKQEFHSDVGPAAVPTVIPAGGQALLAKPTDDDALRNKLTAIKAQNERMAQMNGAVADQERDRLWQIQEQNSRLARQVESIKVRTQLSLSTKRQAVNAMQKQLSAEVDEIMTKDETELTDDDRRTITRLEARLQIGSTLLFDYGAAVVNAKKMIADAEFHDDEFAA